MSARAAQPVAAGPPTKYKPNYLGIGKMVLQGVAGAGAFILGAKLLNFFEGKTEQYPLVPQPENFDIDRTAYHLFHRLQKWAKYDPKNYENCLCATDALLRIEGELRKDKPQIELEDMARSENLFKIALSSINSFYATIRENHKHEITPREMIRLEYEVDIMGKFLGKHLVEIYSLTTFL